MTDTLPTPLRRLFDRPGIDLVLRIALAAPFLQSAVAKALDLPAAQAEMLEFGLPEAMAFAVIATQGIGSALLLGRSLCWLGAGMLSIFTALATLLAHAFWQLAGTEQAHQTATFFEHIAIIGGLGFAAVLAHRTARG